LPKRAFLVLITAAAALITVAPVQSALAATPSKNTGIIMLYGHRCLAVGPHKAITSFLCGSHVAPNGTADEWTMNPNQTISYAGGGGCLVAPVRNGPLKLGSCASSWARWLPTPGFRFQSLQANLSPQDPQCLTIGRRYLYLQPCPKATWIFRTDTWFGASYLSERPDSGGGGTWASDTIIRSGAVTWLGGDNFDAAISDYGRFTTIPGALTPNQALDPGEKLGTALTGDLSGHWGFLFTASGPAIETPPARVTGDTDPTGTWYELFFPGGTVFGGQGGITSGPAEWSWSYASRPDQCGHVEHWVDGNNDFGGQVISGGTDITAPAAC
jgi:hypothetical protein